MCLFARVNAGHRNIHIYGEYTTALAYGAVLTVPVTVMNMVLVKKIGSYDQNKRSFFVGQIETTFKVLAKNNWFWLLLILISTTILIYWQSHLKINSVIFILIYSLTTLVFTLYSSAFQATKKFNQGGLINIISIIVKIGLLGLLIWFSLSLNYLYSTVILSFIVYIYLSRKKIYENQNQKKITNLKINFFRLINKNIMLIALSTLGRRCLCIVTGKQIGRAHV